MQSYTTVKKIHNTRHEARIMKILKRRRRRRKITDLRKKKR